MKRATVGSALDVDGAGTEMEVRVLSQPGLSDGGSSPVTGQTASTVLANTTAGTIRGRVDYSAEPIIFRYLGVPFATPPVDDLRFQPPKPTRSSNSQRSAWTFTSHGLDTHSGGYFLGTASTYNGTRLARQGGVVVVTINYRLEVFGFLGLGRLHMPGNYGLLDQIEALKWVRDNIANFGGDPNSVTIFGQSAGAGSVSLLVLPLAKKISLSAPSWNQ
ncbi:hypothetical protein RRG08_062185, partial [Elysia crispata]